MVEYPFSTDEEDKDELLPNKIPKVDLERPIIPNILPITPWDIENEWELSDQWPPVEEASVKCRVVWLLSRCVWESTGCGLRVP